MRLILCLTQRMLGMQIPKLLLKNGTARGASKLRLRRAHALKRNRLRSRSRFRSSKSRFSLRRPLTRGGAGAREGRDEGVHVPGLQQGGTSRARVATREGTRAARPRRRRRPTRNVSSIRNSRVPTSPTVAGGVPVQPRVAGNGAGTSQTATEPSARGVVRLENTRRRISTTKPRVPDTSPSRLSRLFLVAGQ